MNSQYPMHANADLPGTAERGQRISRSDASDTLPLNSNIRGMQSMLTKRVQDKCGMHSTQEMHDKCLCVQLISYPMSEQAYDTQIYPCTATCGARACRPVAYPCAVWCMCTLISSAAACLVKMSARLALPSTFLTSTSPEDTLSCTHN